MTKHQEYPVWFDKDGVPYKENGELYKIYFYDNAYPLILCTNKRMTSLHRLVCEAFHGPCPSSNHEVDHIDDNRLNFCPSNLRWLTISENRKKSWSNMPIEKRILRLGILKSSTHSTMTEAGKIIQSYRMKHSWHKQHGFHPSCALCIKELNYRKYLESL